MKQLFILFIVMVLTMSAFAQKKIKVLFIGNSYTYVNDLPNTIVQVAAGLGDTVIYDSNAIGGYTLQQHSTNATTLSKIAHGGWDYVVLQEQSQLPSFPPSQVETDVYPYAHILDSLIHAADSCTETVFYMTWGKKNGDSANCNFYPTICTYSGCQDRLSQSYLEMGRLDHATVAPVGEAWRRVIVQHEAFDLFQSDQSHPTIYGTYLTAAVFYEMLFQKSVLTDSFVTTGISAQNAQTLRQAAHSTVSDTLYKWFGNGHIPIASFQPSVSGQIVEFVTTSVHGQSWHWSFSDGTTDTGAIAIHYFATPGTYYITLTISEGCRTSTVTDSLTVIATGLGDESGRGFRIYPNPASNMIHMDLGDMDATDSVITLTDAQGRSVRKIISASVMMSMEVSDLSAGVYTLSVAGHSYPVIIRK